MDEEEGANEIQKVYKSKNNTYIHVCFFTS